MTAKKLFTRSVLLFFLAVTVIATHLSLSKDVTWLSEWLYAPAYTPPSRQEALELGNASYERDLAKSSQAIAEWEACQENNDQEYARYICRGRPAEVDHMTAEELLESGMAIHRYHFIYNEIAPHGDTSADLITYFFVSIYVCIALVQLRFMLMWFRAACLPALRDSAGRVRAVAPDLALLKGAMASRRLRRMEAEFNTLKNLHENGLIDEADFQRRKAELKATLDSKE